MWINQLHLCQLSGSATNELCNHEQVTLPLWALASSTICSADTVYSCCLCTPASSLLAGLALGVARSPTLTVWLVHAKGLCMDPSNGLVWAPSPTSIPLGSFFAFVAQVSLRWKERQWSVVFFFNQLSWGRECCRRPPREKPGFFPAAPSIERNWIPC